MYNRENPLYLITALLMMVQPVQVAAHAASSRKETPNGSASRLEQFTHTLVAYDPGIYCIF